MNFLRGAVCSAVILMLLGCATLWGPPGEDPEARRIIDALLQQNEQLMQYKALANVTLRANGKAFSGRVALAANLPDKLRLEWLSALGQPLTRLAGDGRQISIEVSGESEIRHLSQTPAALESLIEIPIGIEDLQSLATGRVNLPDFVSAQVQRRDPQRVVVVLKDRWHRSLAEIDTEPDTHRILRLEYLDRDGSMVYTIHWRQWQQSGIYTIPKHVELTAANQGRLTFSMARFWPDADVPASAFQLTRPVEKPE
jgi:outer membrane biogenesis lipoprotein LolB